MVEFLIRFIVNRERTAPIGLEQAIDLLIFLTNNGNNYRKIIFPYKKPFGTCVKPRDNVQLGF